jgi:hypothetical protein
VNVDNCATCGGRFISYNGESMTLIGYIQGKLPTEWCNHDDNCRVRVYECENGHFERISVINKCHMCGWTGKRECFCSRKVTEWPILKSAHLSAQEGK